MPLDGPRLVPLSNSRPDALVMLIHGYGSNGDDLISLAEIMQPALPGAAFVAPNAPLRIPHMAAAHQWWPIETFSMAERAAGAAAAAPGLDDFITEELDKAELPNDRLLLIGFSQGTMMALHIGLHGTDDDVVPFGSMALASTALAAVNVPVETHVSPGTGHAVAPDGIEAATAFARRVLS